MAGLAGYGLVDPYQDPGSLADGPFSPWRERDQLNPGEVADFDSKPPSLLEDLWLAGFADLYRVLAGIMSPAEADECELWQIAALLGADRPEAQDDPMARVAAQVVGADGPVDVTARMMQEMGIQTR
jgi:hypothetical protein